MFPSDLDLPELLRNIKTWSRMNVERLGRKIYMQIENFPLDSQIFLPGIRQITEDDPSSFLLQ